MSLSSSVWTSYHYAEFSPTTHRARTLMACIWKRVKIARFEVRTAVLLKTQVSLGFDAVSLDELFSACNVTSQLLAFCADLLSNCLWHDLNICFCRYIHNRLRLLFLRVSSRINSTSVSLVAT
jgi:hypothetical protein